MRWAQHIEPNSPVLARSEWENNAVLTLGLAQKLAILGALGCIAGMSVPVEAGESSGCNWAKATTFRAAAERYGALGQPADAAGWFLAAMRSTSECRSPSGSILSARSLVQAGAALAASGDYLRALSLLHTAQSDLTAIGASDRKSAAAVRPLLDLAETVISFINASAQGSM
jgi:hypothetical protein